MQVFRGRAREVTVDRAITRRLADRVAAGGDPVTRVWRPPCQVAFGRRDRQTPRYHQARRTAAVRGYPVIDRDTGGRAVAHTGATIAFVRIEPAGSERTGLDRRYERTLGALQDGLAELGVDAKPGEPPKSFCPGAYSLRAGGKLAGLAQRVGNGVATVGGMLIVGNRDRFLDILQPVYGALGLPLDAEAVGSLRRAGGPDDPDEIVATIERALVGEDRPTVKHVEATGSGTTTTQGMSSRDT